MAERNTTSEVEPNEMNGSGSPVGGISPVTTQRFKIVWIPITAVMPEARYAPKRLRAFKAIFIPQIIIPR